MLARTRWVHDAYDSLFWRVPVGLMKHTIRCCGTYALKMKRVRGSYAHTYVLHVALVPLRVNLVMSMHPPPCCLSLGFSSPPHSRNMPPFKEYQQLGRTKRWERLAELQTAVTEIPGPTWQVQAGENVGTLILKTTEGLMPQNHMWHAEALLWDCHKEGKRWRALQYSIPTSRIKCPLDEIKRVKDELSAPPVVDYNAMDGDHTLLGAGTNLREKMGLMMAALKGILYPDLWVRLCVDGTQLHKRHLEHFMLGVLGSGNSLGSWCILHGSEKRAVLRSLTRVRKWMSRCKRP